eukprot:g73856.t1
MAMCMDDENSEPEQAKGDQRGNTTANPTPETGHRHHIDSCTPSHRHDPTDNQHRTSFVHVELETLEIEQLREAAPEQVDEDGLEAEDHEKATSEACNTASGTDTSSYPDTTQDWANASSM